MAGVASGAVAGAIRSAVIANPGAGDFRPLQNGDWPATGRRNDSAELPISEDVAHQPAGSHETGELPDVGASEKLSVVKA